MRKLITLFTATITLVALAAFAGADDFVWIKNEIAFRKYIVGKTFVNKDATLVISKNNRITGNYKNAPLTGIWLWQNGYFCRTISVAGKNQGTDCQTVEMNRNGNNMRITRNSGKGEAVEYRLQ